MKRRHSSQLLALLAGILLLASCEQRDTNDGTGDNPLLQDILNETSQFRGFKYREFASAKGWNVWYFQTDLGFKCIGSKSAEGEPSPAPEAVFERRSIGDVRMDIWITRLDGNEPPNDQIPIVRVPNFETDLDISTAGTFRPQGAAFMQDLRYYAIKDLAGQKVEIQAIDPIGDPNKKYMLDLAGLPDVIATLKQCEDSGPKN